MRMETNFAETSAYTVGVEEEFQLIDPTSLALIPAIDAVLAARDEMMDAPGPVPEDQLEELHIAVRARPHPAGKTGEDPTARPEEANN